MDTTHMPTDRCPVCRHELDAATATQRGTRPRPGCISLCVYCGAVNLFADDMTVRRPTADELARLKASDTWPLIQKAVRAIIRAKATRPLS